VSAATILAALAILRPAQYHDNPERLALVANVVEQVAGEYAPRWRWGRPMLEAAIATAIDQESGLLETVHDGTLRGKAGEVCLMQVHPQNHTWQRLGIASFDALGGTDYQSTLNCVRTGTASLVFAAHHCYDQNYHRNWARAMWTQYHFGNRCWISPHAKKRAALMTRIASTHWAPTTEQREQLNATKQHAALLTQ